MGIKSFLSKPLAYFVAKQIKKWSSNPIETQEKVFKNLISKAKNTQFGKDHRFEEINNYEDFKKRVPVVDYEDFKKYINLILEGKSDVIWPEKPIYFCKTSGTTSGVKYIPISKDSISNHINGARNAILSYIADTGKSDFVEGNMIFLSGSPVLSEKAGIKLGRLSGIVNHHVPGYLRTNQLPKYETNCIEDWETKVETISKETLNRNMTLISGIPSWVQMYFEKLLELSKTQNIKDLFPNFSLFIYGGVNYEPYRQKFEALIGKRIDSIELYPASEGFIAYQNKQNEEGLLLILNDGIFYEFIPANEYFDENPTRISLKDVELGVNYALILNTNAGLWGYSIGDTVKFVSKTPYKIIVSGRIKHFISAFGEHVIAEEVEKAMKNVVEKLNIKVSEFTIAPNVNPENNELPFHEWFVEFEEMPQNIAEMRNALDDLMREYNIYYNDLIAGNVLQKLKISPIQKGGFIAMMKTRGKLGGQNKIPRLSNDRILATELEPFKLNKHSLE
jgi:hypothetical protein